MDDKAKIAALEIEIEQRKRVLFFLTREFVSRKDEFKPSLVEYLNEIGPELPPTPTSAVMVNEMLTALGQS